MRILPIATLLLAAMGGACGDDTSPAAPSTVPACQVGHTGTVTFTNNTGFSIDVLWNGVEIQTLAPGVTGPEISVAAGGTQYSFDFKISGTTPPFRPCSPLMVTPLECVKNAYGTCSFR
jgi:hypothetical protein